MFEHFTPTFLFSSVRKYGAKDATTGEWNGEIYENYFPSIATEIIEFLRFRDGWSLDEACKIILFNLNYYANVTFCVIICQPYNKFRSQQKADLAVASMTINYARWAFVSSVKYFFSLIISSLINLSSFSHEGKASSISQSLSWTWEFP